VTAPLLVFAATYFLIAVQRVRWLHLNRPAAGLLGYWQYARAGVPVTLATLA
jgi:hypothetical protein